jgi:alkylation response protein AidB-like acyl-CoA dehydrogenase
MGTWVDCSRIAATALGVARGALDDFLALADAKTPAYTQTVIADRPTVQDRAARARALIEAGHSYLHAAVGAAWEVVQAGPRLNAETGLPVGLSATFAMDAAVRAGDLLYELTGSSGFRDEQPIQRRFRDLQTLRQNAITSTARYESLGKLMLGRQSDWAFHYL